MSELISYIILKGKLTAETSLFINIEQKKSPPSIPAHLMRSKMRNLLELSRGLKKNGTVHKCENKNCFLCLLFGSPFLEGEGARLTVREGKFDKFLKEQHSDKKNIFPFDIKWEGNKINYRIPAGAVFSIEFLYKIFTPSDYENFKYIIEAIELLEDDYLGKGGARGTGKISFFDFTLDIKLSDKFPDLPPGWKAGEKTDKGIKIVRT